MKLICMQLSMQSSAAKGSGYSGLTLSTLLCTHPKCMFAFWGAVVCWLTNIVLSKQDKRNLYSHPQCAAFLQLLLDKTCAAATGWCGFNHSCQASDRKIQDDISVFECQKPRLSEQQQALNEHTRKVLLAKQSLTLLFGNWYQINQNICAHMMHERLYSGVYFLTNNKNCL